MNSSFIMPYSLGTNFDKRLFDVIDEYDTQNLIKSLFGKLQTDFVGGGRSSLYLPNITWNDLQSYIENCHNRNIEFNYLLNPMCMSNKEFIKKTNRKLVDYIKKLHSVGVDAVTINSPYLCELIKSNTPELKVTVGLYALVGTVQQVRYWEQLGADEITLDDKINRNFNLLKSLLIKTKNSGIKLRVIANNVCLHECPYSVLHGTNQAHASEHGHNSKDLPVDYCVLKCNLTRFTNPVKFITSDWIRPEDVQYYENLCNETGNYNFSIKLLERTKSTEFLSRVVKAYISKKYDGNLLDILNVPSKNEISTVNYKSIYKQVIQRKVKLKNIFEYEKIFDLPEVYIDNQSLEGFLEKFIRNYDCDLKCCDDEEGGEEKLDPNIQCGYCRRWANKAITYNDASVVNWSDQCNRYLSNFKKGL